MKTGLKKKSPPFVRAFKAIVRNPKLSLQSRAVFDIIKSFANNDGTHCFPSMDKIAEYAGCSSRTVCRYVRELRKAGLLHNEQRLTEGKQRSSCTFLLYDDIHARNAQKPRANRVSRPKTGMSCGEVSKIVPITEGMKVTA